MLKSGLSSAPRMEGDPNRLPEQLLSRGMSPSRLPLVRPRRRFNLQRRERGSGNLRVALTGYTAEKDILDSFGPSHLSLEEKEGEEERLEVERSLIGGCSDDGTPETGLHAHGSQFAQVRQMFTEQLQQQAVAHRQEKMTLQDQISIQNDLISRLRENLQSHRREMKSGRRQERDLRQVSKTLRRRVKELEQELEAVRSEATQERSLLRQELEGRTQVGWGMARRE